MIQLGDRWQVNEKEISRVTLGCGLRSCVCNGTTYRMREAGERIGLEGKIEALKGRC